MKPFKLVTNSIFKETHKTPCGPNSSLRPPSLAPRRAVPHHYHSHAGCHSVCAFQQNVHDQTQSTHTTILCVYTPNINYSRVLVLGELTCNTEKAPVLTTWHVCVALKRHMRRDSPAMIMIMENAYICGAHICARHHVRTLYSPSHLTYRPSL